jgi:DNA repair exonuclease SbcCD ATPase subunit
VSDSPFSAPAPSGSGSGVKIAILFGAVVALIAASVYQFYQVSQLRSELATTRDSLTAKMSEIHETSTVSTQTNRKQMEAVKADVDKYRAQSLALTGAAKLEAIQHADEAAAKLEKLQQEQGRQVAAVSKEVGAVKADTATRFTEVNTDVSNVKSDLGATKSELEKTIADLKSTRGDLGVQSGLIATNGKELAALKALGERNYIEFKIGKTKAPQKVGDIAVLLKKTDPKKNRYTIEVIADDKTVEKKDKTINEPVQFLLSKATQPYELVVNDVKKDLITGYVAAPKVQTTRNN